MRQVGQMRQGVLNGAAAGSPVFVIDFAIGGPKRGEILPRRSDQLQRLADIAGRDPRANRFDRRMHPVAVGRFDRLRADRLQQPRHVFQLRRQRFLDQKRSAGTAELHHVIDVQVRGRADDGGVPGLPGGVVKRGERIPDLVAGRHVSPPLVDRLDECNLPVDRPLKTPQMPLADRPGSDDQNTKHD
jgi:hypothetical protein